MAPPESVPADLAAARRWLAIVGIGEDGVDGLTPVARRLVGSAEIVFGGIRHLALAGPLIRGDARSWPSPFDTALNAVLACRGRRVCVLATGDPFDYGVGPLLARHVPVEEMTVVPSPSAFSLAAARLGWALPETILISLHGRPLDLVRPHLHNGARILALTGDGEAPALLARRITEQGFGDSHLTVLEALGGPRERIRTGSAEKFALDDVDPLNIVAIEAVAGRAARVIPRGAGLADALFEHDGQITKREVRAITLSSLAPVDGERLWDIGAGSGSVAIEWMLAGRAMRAVAIEADAERAARIARNAAVFGVLGLAIVVGEAPEALAGLAPPDAVFVGGGTSDRGVLAAAIAALRPGGRLVANAVTLESEAILLRQRGEVGGDLIRIAIARADPVGGLTGWRPAMPITQWIWVKP